MTNSKKNILEYTASSTELTVPSSDSPAEDQKHVPIGPNPVVDNDRVETDTCDHKPRSRRELASMLQAWSWMISEDQVEDVYKRVKEVFDEAEGQNNMTIEQIIRKNIKALIKEALGAGVDVPEENIKASYEDIAREIVKDMQADAREANYKPGHIGQYPDEPEKISISAVKQLTDKTNFKIQYLRMMDEKIMADGRSELEAFVVDMIDEYIDHLTASGELSKDEVWMLQSNPETIRELPGFRNFLEKKIAGLPKTWPETTMPSYKSFIEVSYEDYVARNKVDRAAKKKRYLDNLADRKKGAQVPGEPADENDENEDIE